MITREKLDREIEELIVRSFFDLDSVIWAPGRIVVPFGDIVITAGVTVTRKIPAEYGWLVEVAKYQSDGQEGPYIWKKIYREDSNNEVYKILQQTEKEQREREENREATEIYSQIFGEIQSQRG